MEGLALERFIMDIEKNKKVCTVCKFEKFLSEFHKRTSSRSGYKSACKSCRKLNAHEFFTKNSSRLKEKAKQYYQENKEKFSKRAKIYHAKNAERQKIKAKEWLKNNREKRRIYCRAYYAENKHKINTPELRFRRSLGKALWKAIKKNKKTSILNYIGTSLEELRKYFASKFYFVKEVNQMMTWENYGTLWHIDHVVPLAFFNLLDEKQIYKAFHFTNLQPLWASENLSKNSKHNGMLIRKNKICI